MLRSFHNFRLYASRVDCTILLCVCIFLPLSFQLMGGEFSRIAISVLQNLMTMAIVLALTGGYSAPKPLDGSA